MNINNLRKIVENGEITYVEIEEKPVGKPPKTDEEIVCVSTRTLHPTSAMGQIEWGGWIEARRLQPLGKNKVDREAIKTIQALDERAKKVLQAHLNVLKAGQS